MKIAVLHDRVAAGAAADELDTLEQVEAIRAVAARLGHDVVTGPVDLDLHRARERLIAARLDLVFNLVETLDGTGRLIHLVPAMLDHLGLPYTGSPTDALYLTSNKPLAKRWLRQNGLPVPDWADAAEGSITGHLTGDRVIVKSAWEHASIGLDEDSVIDALDEDRIRAAATERRDRLGGSAFVETYVEGREFNLSVLQGPRGWEVLAPAEITFEGFAAGQPRIVGYRAKWDRLAPEYRGTVRKFDFGAADRPLLAELTDLARECCRVFPVRGYARIDFRVSRDGRPWILEVNANPCLNQDAGFAAAAARSGYDYATLIERLIDMAVGGHSSQDEPRTTPVPRLSPDRLPIEFSPDIRPDDRRAIAGMVHEGDLFSAAEARLTLEVLDEALGRGRRSGYHFVAARKGRTLVGFSCFGPVPGTASRFDLYWIAVERTLRSKGVGRSLLQLTEARARSLGGRYLQVDTSGRAAYEPTRRFYEALGYQREAELGDFYGPGDPKVIYGKPLADDPGGTVR